MLRSKRLEVVLSLEERKEQEALERLGEARKQVEAHREQVENLERYQQEYRDQIRASQQGVVPVARLQAWQAFIDRKSIRLNSSHVKISYAVFCLKKKKR